MKKHFTLTEILVVVFLIGVLTAIGFGMYSYAMNSAKESGTRALLTRLEAALETCNTKFGYIPTTISSGGNVAFKEIQFEIDSDTGTIKSLSFDEDKKVSDDYLKEFLRTIDAENLKKKLSAGRAAIQETDAREETVDLGRPDRTQTEEESEYKGPSVVSYSLDGRKASRLSIPAYRCMGGGEVTVIITVDPHGNVIDAKVYDAVSSQDRCLREFAIRAARLSRFSVLSPDRIREMPRQKGEIVYRFIAQ